MKIRNYEYNLNASVSFKISANRPEISIQIPTECSIYSCELNRIYEFQCKITNEESDVNFLMVHVPCNSFDDCYNQSTLRSNKSVEDLSLDLHKSAPMQSNYLSNSTFVTRINASRPYLFICAAENSFGKTFKDLIMIPGMNHENLISTNSTSYSKNQSLVSKMKLTKGLNFFELIEKDLFKIRFDEIFGNSDIFFKNSKNGCVHEGLVTLTKFTYLYYWSFKNLSLRCNNEYYIKIESKNEPYLNNSKIAILLAYASKSLIK